MIFSSLEFICVFFPVVFLLYYLLPGIRAKNALLIAASLLFYAYGEPQYVVLMIFSAGFNYLFAGMVEKFPHKKLLLSADVALNLGLLACFKYLAFLIDTCNQVLGLHVEAPETALPIGISFFTFQALSYVIDVYYGKVQVQKSFWKVLLYISFFPQLIAGPIVKYREIDEALTGRKTDLGQISEGIRRFICGLGKKVLIANTMGYAADAVFQLNISDINMLTAWIGAVSYMMQIYYDFSGYSDMAIGLGKMFGFQFRENFRYPYGAASIKEFWHRWHISLSSWFKDYLYIPLGGNRKGEFRTGMNKLAVFFFTGLWHGANWTFVVWGLYHGFFSVLEDRVPFVKKIPKPLAHFYTLLVVCIGFVIFRADSISHAGAMTRQMFTGTCFDSRSMSFAIELLTPWFLVMLAAAVVGAAPIRPLTRRIQKIMDEKTGASGEKTGCAGAETDSAGSVFVKNVSVRILLSAGSVALLVWCMIRLSGGTYNPFIYFRF